MRGFRATVGLRLSLALLGIIGLPGCADVQRQRLGIGEVPTLLGSSVRDNRTPMDASLACLARSLGQPARPVVIAVGDVRDYTGKYSINEGNAVTQGGALMVSSALGKLAPGIALAERFDPTIAERELGYTDRRQLGDGQAHDVPAASGTSKVSWLPYFGGSIAASDYYIVGGITELNYDIRSGGVEASVGQTGPKARTYTQSIAIDLRIVDTRSLLVARTISLTKQFTGYEIGFNLFRFFGSGLFDINIGAKGQEPLQLGVRTALEEAVARLVGTVTHVDPTDCLRERGWPAVEGDGETHSLPSVPTFIGSSPHRPASAASGSSLLTAAAPAVRLMFDFDATTLSATAAGALDAIATAGVPVDVEIVAADIETPDPVRRDALIDQRIASVLAALAVRGITASAVKTIWRPASTDSVSYRADAGRQIVARLRVRR